MHFLLSELTVSICQQTDIMKKSHTVDSHYCSHVFEQFYHLEDVFLKTQVSKKQTLRLLQYPINFARNFARKQAKTNFILIADLDHIFSENFEPKVRDLAIKVLTPNVKRVLVYRIFEVDHKAPWPKNKTTLSDLLESGEAVEFHSNYTDAHQIPHLKAWLDEEDHGNTTNIQFNHP